VRTIAPMPLRSGYAVVLFNSDGPMLLFFKPDRQSASVLNKGDLWKTAFLGTAPEKSLLGSWGFGWPYSHCFGQVMQEPPAACQLK